jgi:hypothetical protein
VKTIIIATLGLTMFAATAQAQSQPLEVSRTAVMQGKNEISTQLGFQASLGGTTPSGVKMFFDYSRYLGSVVWLNFKLNPTFAASARVTCNGYDCGYGLIGDGDSLDVLAGVKLKFPMVHKLVPYANINVGVVGIYDRPYGDDGAAAVFRGGGGLRWFVTPHVAIGGEMNFTLGGGFYGETCPGCQNGHNEFYRAFDMALGAEFVL